MEEITKQDLKEWLTEKYVVDELTARQISKLLYGVETNSPNVLNYLHLFNIPIRVGSDAIKIQWKNAEERRYQASKTAKQYLCSYENRELIKEIQSTKEYHEKASKCKRGSNNPMWNNNLTEEQREALREGRRSSEDYLFRKQVFKRDDYTCQKCGSSGVTLNAHHILNYKDNPDTRYDVDNGITLCDKCHIQFHRQYGYRHNTVEQLLEYLE